MANLQGEEMWVLFGYVMPHIPNLKVCEHEIYKATYCGLCKQIKKKIGGLFRLNLSYDMVFFAMFFMAYLQEPCEFEKKFCKLHPFKKKICIKNCKALNKAANIGGILFYFKIKDNIKDCKGFKKFLNWFILIFLKRSYNKLKQNEEQIAEFVLKYFNDQNKLEQKNNLSLDCYSHPTADCLGKIFKSLSKNKTDEITLYRIGYMLGKYIYLIDALDDFEKDIKNNSFNPIVAAKFQKTNNDTFKKLNQLINFSIAQLAESFEMLNLKSNVEILRNVIYLGLKATTEKIFKKNTKMKSLLVGGLD